MMIEELARVTSNQIFRFAAGCVVGVLVILLAIISQGCDRHDTPLEANSDRERAGLLGKVKEVIATDSFLITTERYDVDGKLLEEIRDLRSKKSPTERPLSHYAYVYDAQSRRIAARSGRSAANSPPDLIRYFYNTAGKKVAEVDFSPDGTTSGRKTFYTYDAEGQLRGRVSEFIGTVIVEDIVKGHPIKSVSFEKGRIKSEIVLSYGQDGRLKESQYYQSNGALGQKQLYEYDARGNVSQEAVYAADGTLLGRTTWTYTYDNKGNWIKKAGSEMRAVPSGQTSESTAERKITYYD